MRLEDMCQLKRQKLIVDFANISEVEMSALDFDNQGSRQDLASS